MTLSILLTRVAIAAAILLAIIAFGYKKPKNWLMAYAQYFCGVLFIFSGMVKAVDPLGTAYKMEQYFSEFKYTFEETWMSFIAPIFPFLSGFSAEFSVFMIIFEIILGIMLIMGNRPKLTAWLFFLLVFFFTFLTGFTYLTGYVPQGVNFFSFGQWGPYVESNMKVTDCGCFGDFLKLKPRISFFKDVFLMVPAIFFLWKSKAMHKLFDIKIENIVVGISTIGLLIYCLSNFAWNIPGQDFRPFKKGADVRTIKAAEEKAQSEIKITHYLMKNKETGESLKLEFNKYMSNYKDYPKEKWEIVEQIKTEPAIEPTKISDFDFSDADGNSMVEDFLNHQGYSLMVVSYKLKTDKSSFINNYKDKIIPMAQKAEAAGVKVIGLVGGAGQETIEAFRHQVQAAYPIYEADDILLKTIVRSNPGVVLWKDGNIVNKWHISKLPEFENLGM